MSGESEPLEATAYARFEVDCSACSGAVTTEHDPSGEVITCDCGAKLRVTETR